MSKSLIELTIDSGPKKGETLDRNPGSLIRIGRVVKGNTLAIKDPSISQKHLTIEFDPQISRWVLSDLGTSNGTFVNGERVAPPGSVPVSDGDVVKIGESTFISVRVTVVEESVRGVGRNGGRKGKRSAMGLMKEESLKKDFDKGEVLGSDLGDGVEAPKNAGRGRRKNSTRVLKEDKILGGDVEGTIEAPENLGRSNKADDSEEIAEPTCDSVPMKDLVEDRLEQVTKCLGRGRKRNKTDDFEEITDPNKKNDALDSVVEERAQKVPKNFRRGRRNVSVSKQNAGSSNNVGVSKTKPSMGRTRSAKVSVDFKDFTERDCESVKMKDSANEDRAKAVPKNLGRGIKRNKADDFAEITDLNCEKFSMKDENSNSVVEHQTQKVRKNLGRGRRNNLVSVPEKHVGLKYNAEVPKTMTSTRRTRTSKVPDNDGISNLVPEVKIPVLSSTRVLKIDKALTQILEKDSSSDLVAKDITEQPENLGKQKGGNSDGMLMEDENLEPAKEGFIEAKKNMGRGKRKNLVSDPKKDGSKESVKVPKTMPGTRRTGSTKASENSDNSNLVHEDMVPVLRSTRVSKLDKAFDVVDEDKTEVPKNQGKGKERENSYKVSKIDEILDEVVEDEAEVVKNVGKGKTRRAPARRTRASSRVLKDEACTVLNPVENLYLSDYKIQEIPHKITSSSADSNIKTRANREEDKENHVSFKCQETENEIIAGSVDTKTHEPCLVLAKEWNGNGIPNTTTKYKEDQKVKFHATPFEERLEKALSDDNLFPQRNLSN